jgi:Sjoegren syndrome nuclear autoantigen 1
MNNISPSTLQTFNNELVKGLETLREKHFETSQILIKKQEIKQNLSIKIEQLNQEFIKLNDEINEKNMKKLELEKLIEQTEIAYLKIVESSQTLLDLLQSQLRQ